MSALERKPWNTPRVRTIVARARYSAPTGEEIAEEARADDEHYKRDPRWWYRWRWGLTLVGLVVWFILAYVLDIVFFGVLGWIVGAFWFLAIGTMPHMAAWHLGRDLLDGDE